MSDLLSIGASGVRAYQSALGTVSENIANSGVAGYSRRTTDLSEVVAPNGAGFSASKVARGLGVTVAGITRQADAFKADAARSAGADLAKTTASIEWLDRIEGAMTGGQLGARITGFFNAARQLAADPSSSAPRALMLEAATSVAASFGATAAALDRVLGELDATARDTTDRLDGLGKALATLNERMGRAAPGSAAAAGLADERDRLLEEMSAISDVRVSTDPIGRATVRLGGSGGPLFVSGVDAGEATYARSDTGVVTFAVNRGGESVPFTPNGGALGALADAASRIKDARTRLEDVAAGFAQAVNETQAAGVGLDGAPGGPMFETGADPTGMRVALANPGGIAAAAADAGPRDGSNLDLLEKARATGGYEGAVANLITTNAAALQQRRAVADAQAAIRNGAVAARDAISAVDLDTEAVDLIRFQQAYQASSRVIQVARETFQSILEVR